MYAPWHGLARLSWPRQLRPLRQASHTLLVRFNLCMNSEHLAEAFIPRPDDILATVSIHVGLNLCIYELDEAWRGSLMARPGETPATDPPYASCTLQFVYGFGTSCRVSHTEARRNPCDSLHLFFHVRWIFGRRPDRGLQHTFYLPFMYAFIQVYMNLAKKLVGFSWPGQARPLRQASHTLLVRFNLCMNLEQLAKALMPRPGEIPATVSIYISCTLQFMYKSADPWDMGAGV